MSDIAKKELEKYGLDGVVRDQSGESYVWKNDEGEGIRLISLNSSELAAYLRMHIYRELGKYIPSRDLEVLIEEIGSIAEIHGEQVNLGIRTAWKDGDIYLDTLGKSIGIKGDGRWSIEPCDKPLFRRNKSMRALVEPTPGGDIKKILRFTNVREDSDEVLLLTWLVYSLVPDLPHPILCINGPQGSAKSSLTRLLISLVDPNVVGETNVHSEQDFYLACRARWLISLDNISRITPRFSDALCKLVTGASFSKRMLYTTDSLLHDQFSRPVILNGIGMPMEKADLLDRTIILQLERIPNSKRKDEAALKKEFEECKGEIFGGCLDALALARTILPSVPYGIFDTRMMDYARWGCAIAEALGISRERFISAIQRNTQRQNEESLDSSPICSILSAYFARSRTSELKGTATEILTTLRVVLNNMPVESRLIPHTPKLFSKGLLEIRPSLETGGFLIHFARGKKRLWTITPPSNLIADPETHEALDTLASKTSKTSQNSQEES